MTLNQDQKDIREWVHGFAEGVMRPAAAEWDEREETPWPVIQEAAKIGLYGFEGLAQFWADPSGLTLPIVNEELFWGDAGIGMAIGMAGSNQVTKFIERDLVFTRSLLSAAATLFVLAAMPSFALAVTGKGLDRLADAFRSLLIPVIGRIQDGMLLFDLRTLDDEAAFVAQLPELAP